MGILLGEALWGARLLLPGCDPLPLIFGVFSYGLLQTDVGNEWWGH